MPDRNETATAAAAALEDWDIDAADNGDVIAVFTAIYERSPDAEDGDIADLVSTIFAARDHLTAEEAARVLAVLA